MPNSIVGKVSAISPAGDYVWVKCKDKHYDVKVRLKDPDAGDIGLGTFLAFDEECLQRSSLGWYETSIFSVIQQDEVKDMHGSSHESAKTGGHSTNICAKKDDDQTPGTTSYSQDRFTYPYNFVSPGRPLSPKMPVAVFHDRFRSDLFSGEIVCVMTAKTPLFVPDPEGWQAVDVGGNKTHWEKPFFKLPNGRYAVPGSSVKGIIRSMAEAASNSCFSIFNNQRYAYRLNRNLPERHPGIVINNRTQVKKMQIAKIDAYAFAELGNPEDKNVLPVSECCDANKIEFKYVQLFRRGAPEVVWAKCEEKEWPPLAPGDTATGKGKIIRDRTGRHFVVKQGLHYRVPPKFAHLKGQIINFKAQKFPRQSRGAQWYIFEVNGESALEGPIIGYVKTATGLDKTSKKTHQVFFEMPSAPTFDLDINVIDDYREAQRGKDNKNPSELIDGQLVFFSRHCN